MVSTVDFGAFLEGLHSRPEIPASKVREQVTSLDEEQLLHTLKMLADQAQESHPSLAMLYGELMIRLGKEQNNHKYIAMGTMVSGDAAYNLGDPKLAWALLEEAGSRFENEAQFPIGWARTRIAKIRLGNHLDRVDEVLADVPKARQILIAGEVWDRLVILDMNLGALFDGQYQCEQAIGYYQRALEICKKLPEGAASYFQTRLTHNLACSYQLLGQFDQARTLYQEVLNNQSKQQDKESMALTRVNLAGLDQLQGRYRYALSTLIEVMSASKPDTTAAFTAKLNMIYCHLKLGDFHQAEFLARQLYTQSEESGHQDWATDALLVLADSYEGLGDWETTEQTLAKIASQVHQHTLSAFASETRLRQIKLLLRSGKVTRAKEELAQIVPYWREQKSALYLEEYFLILRAQIAFDEQDLVNTDLFCKEALSLGENNGVTWLEHTALTLLALHAQRVNNNADAIRYFKRAIEIVDSVQRELTITFRHTWLTETTSANQGLISIYLQQGETESAFLELEHLKSQVWLRYALDPESLNWNHQERTTQVLIKNLVTLRGQYQQLLEDKSIDSQLVIDHMRDLESRIRGLRDQLYLQSETILNEMQSPSLAQIQNALTENTVLVSYFIRGNAIWAFLITQEGATQVQLGIRENEPPDHDGESIVSIIRDKAAQANLQIRRAVSAGLKSPSLPVLQRKLDTILDELYQLLIKPLMAEMARLRSGHVESESSLRMVIVPYGFLHTVPFHLLRNNQKYLCQVVEVSFLPAASMLLKPPIVGKRGAKIMATSSADRLPFALQEAQAVADICHVDAYLETDSTFINLQGPAQQILHIASHGAFNYQSPSLSFITLMDGYLWADDLFQLDLSYELVTLSACQTGVATPSGGDDLLGIGRGVIYRAGALAASLWRVNDLTTLDLMKRFYTYLKEGKRKSEAMCLAQREIASQGLHPAFWGAFQIIGDVRPLSINEKF